MFAGISFFSILLILALGVLKKPAIALAGVICLYGIKQWGMASSEFLLKNSKIANFGVAIIVVLGIIRLWRSGAGFYYAKKMPAAWVLGLILYLYAFVSLWWGPNPSQALEVWGLEYPYMLVIAVLAPILVTDLDDIYPMVNWTMLVGSIIGILLVFKANWGGRGIIYYGEVSAFYESNPLALASMGGTLTVISAMLLFHKGKVIRWLWLFPVGLLGAWIMLRSGSRGQLGAAAIAIFIGLILSVRKSIVRPVLVFGLALFIFVLVGVESLEKYGFSLRRWVSTDQSAQDMAGRYEMAIMLLSYWRSNLLSIVFGLGNSSAFHYIGWYPHITPLEVLAEEGFVGLVIYLAMLFFAVREALIGMRIAKFQKNEKLFQVVTLLVALFVFEWVLTLKQGSLLSNNYMIAYAAILGRVVYYYEKKSLKSDLVENFSQGKKIVNLCE